MPVPVSRTVKSQAHPVIKPYHRVRGHTLSSTSIPGPQLPPVKQLVSSALQEEWGSSFPSWRRNQLQRPSLGEDATVQGFHKGLTAADNASVIKGAHAEACLPPTLSSLQIPLGHSYSREPPSCRPNPDYKVQAAFTFSAQDQARFDSNMQWDVDHLVGPEDDSAMSADRAHRGITAPSAHTPTDSAAFNNRSYQAGVFTSIFEDQSPGSASAQDNDSSPLEPITPFGDFVDRVVADTDPYPTSFSSQHAEQGATADYYMGKHANVESCQAPPVFPTLAGPPQEPIADTITPSSTIGYKTLSEPLSEWVAGYVWEICTTGLSLPYAFAQPSMTAGPYPVSAPSNLAPAIHSLLLSTLLQPSAVFLALWYIVRLPVYFGAAPLSAELVKERAFRGALLGDGYTEFEADSSETSPAFRLVVLGCMLANKWLDDHTFSNKTWHSISNIPVQSLNKLEALTLDIFSYDLSISTQQWSQWLAHVMSYHLSLSSPTYPQPISRPSSNPHSVVRRAIDEIIRVPSIFKPGSPLPQPVFIGLEERLRANEAKENAMDVLEIDLDEDGPLREEYLPRRRANKLGLQNSQTRLTASMSQGPLQVAGKWNLQDMPAIKALPPPAKWSPAGDEPILRDRNCVSGQYVAVQAPSHTISSYPASYHPNDVAYRDNQNWNPSGGYNPPTSFKMHAMMVPDYMSMFQVGPPAYNSFGPIPTLAMPHSRSQSLSYDNDNMRSHMRSYSQSRFEYKNSDLSVMASEQTSFAPFADVTSKWADAHGVYVSHLQAHIHIPAVGMQPPW